ncbi:CIC11C00000005061 [Sungouiella intermedia]|uniref:CIC11C00000001375 n=1 Tax=Sungouiella intermedia TaxID=45354 RepID=A0A1L0D0U5_9ASCO|nr:CIC11C00000005061 [[Candida] intermedia]SGZ49568.1 CIC11C00000001375 [[Candida] intermedia]
MSEQPARFGLENQVKRNPHGDFNKVELERPSFEHDKVWKYTQIPDVKWKVGSGANSDEWKNHKKITIDPYGEGRSPVDNYKTLISAIVPRPIGFVSSISKDGKRNLAPFSYFTMVNHDPPIFTLGFSGGKGQPKDTCRNILETEELTINIISEWFVEAANFCSTNAPHGVDEWKLSGLTPLESEKVKPQHVAESAFSVEAKLVHSHEWKSKSDPSRATGVLCIVEGVNFHVREDVINEAHNNLDISKLKPVSRLGGITYARTVDGYEKLRPDFDKEVVAKEEVSALLE